jgi:heterotetrameric sarcosine oxidase gamma subunit
VAELIATGPFDGTHEADAPFEAGGATLDTLPLGPLAAILPWPGGAAEADAALRAAGLGWPDPGWIVEGPDGAHLAWAGREAAFLIGAAPPEIAGAAVIDLADGWAGLSLSGPGAVAVLARLVPLDLRPPAFPEGRAARTLLGHVETLVMHRAGRFEILVMRSFARTARHEIAAAMRNLAARQDAAG